MRQRRGHLVLVLPLLVLTLFLVGCPKRPATTAASAPPPTAPAPAAPAPGAVAPAPGRAPASASASAPAAAAPAPAAAAPARPAAATPPRPSEFSESPNLKDIHFDFDKYDIRPGDATILDANGAWLKQAASNLVLIEGHADERGTNEYNLALGERRAKATMNYLVSQGIQASRMTIISYGEERPACTDKNESCWSKNRRAHFLVKAR